MANKEFKFKSQKSFMILGLDHLMVIMEALLLLVPLPRQKTTRHTVKQMITVMHVPDAAITIIVVRGSSILSLNAPVPSSPCQKNM